MLRCVILSAFRDVVDDRDRIDLDQVAGGHHRYPDHYVCWFVFSEQRHLGRFNDRHVFVAFVIDDIDCNLADLLRPGTGRSERTAEIAKREARLSREVTVTNKLAVDVFGADRVEVVPRMDDALDNAVTLAEEEGDLGGAGVLVTGSIVTVGDARTLLRHSG